MGLLTNLFRRFKNSVYTAAGMGRRTKSWYAPGLSPNTALTADLSKLRLVRRFGTERSGSDPQP